MCPLAFGRLYRSYLYSLTVGKCFSNIKMSYVCGACRENLSDGAHCTVCNLDYHFHCAAITEGGYRKLGEERKATWRCPKCRQGGQQQQVPGAGSSTQQLHSEVLEDIRSKLAPLATLVDEVKELRAELSNLRTSVNQANNSIQEFNSRFNNIEIRLTKVETTQNQLTELQARLDKLERECDEKDQWSRMNNIEIKGVTLTATENLFDVIKTIGSKINYTVPDTQINFITRVPSWDPKQIKPIIVCFNNRYVKENFVAAARAYSKTQPLIAADLGYAGRQKIFVNDHLSPKYKQLLSKAKTAAKDRNFQYVWVKHSKIFVRMCDTSPVLNIKNEKDLAKII